jgi:hypothetical protein
MPSSAASWAVRTEVATQRIDSIRLASSLTR